MHPTSVLSIRLRGIANTPSPGGDVDEDRVAVREAGTEPSSRSAAAPITCGSAAGQPAKFHGFAGESSPLPTADTTTTPFEYA